MQALGAGRVGAGCAGQAVGRAGRALGAERHGGAGAGRSGRAGLRSRR